MELTKQRLAELESTHKKVIHLKGDDGVEAVFRRPNRQEWREFLTMNEKPGPAAQEYLVVTCCVHPDRAGLDAILDDEPGLIQSFAAKVAAFAGLNKALEVKK